MALEGSAAKLHGMMEGADDKVKTNMEEFAQAFYQHKNAETMLQQLSFDS